MTPENRGWSKVGLIAGGGSLPVKIAAACRSEKIPIFFARLKGFAETTLAEFPGGEFRLGEVGAIMDAMRRAECDAIAFAGVVKRPNFSAIRPDWRGVTLLPRVIAAAARGDDALLTCIIRVFEEDGFKVIGVDKIVADFLAPAGALGVRTPSEADLKDIRKGVGVVRALGAFDVGQGAVICDNLVLAIEAAEGTDAMLDRCAQLPDVLKGEIQNRRGVLVKIPKPDQERRIDLPVIGVQTIEHAAAAGLSGIAVAAGGALVLDREHVIETANQLNMFVYGLTLDDYDDCK